MSEVFPKQRVFDEERREAVREDAGEPRTLVTPPPTEAANAAAAANATNASRAERAVSATAGADLPDDKSPLLANNESSEMRSRWDRIQTEFIDQPRKSVEEANALVADAMTRLTAVFTAQRQEMERQWDRKEDVSTEDLRQALRRYRSFFGRLLAV